MSPEAQRIAIAEACGWTQFDNEWIPPSPNAIYQSVRSSDADCSIYPPDYPSDLNAMHEAIKTLSDKNGKCREFADQLRWVCDRQSSTGLSSRFGRYNATAAQRAEAFLRTIGKWDDTK